MGYDDLMKNVESLNSKIERIHSKLEVIKDDFDNFSAEGNSLVFAVFCVSFTFLIRSDIQARFSA